MPFTNLKYYPLLENAIIIGKQLNYDVASLEEIMFEKTLDYYDFSKLVYHPLHGLIQWRKGLYVLRK